MKNLPNILTVSRILLIAVFVVLASLADYSYFRTRDSVTTLRLVAYILLLLAGVTDFVDGYVARHFNATSDFGALMDPLADKIFVTGCMLISVQYKLMPAWIAIAVLSREFMVTGLRALAAKKQVVISADRWGKLKTFLQMLMLALAGASWIGLYDLKDKSSYHGILLWDLWMAFLVIIVLVTVLSGMGYFIRYCSVFLPGTEAK